MQKSNFDVCYTIKLIESFYNFFKDYKITGFEKPISVAFEFASELDFEPEFNDSNRVRYEKDSSSINAKMSQYILWKKFEIEFFNTLLDTMTSLETLSIENAIAQNLDFSKLIKIFADQKARKVNFY